jgi:hypothetical protein
MGTKAGGSDGVIQHTVGLALAASVLLIGLCLAIVTAVLSRLSGDEISGWLPVWSKHLMLSAVAIVPEQYQARYLEEWGGELAAFRDRRLSGLAFAWRLRRRARSVNAALLDSPTVAEVFEIEPPPSAKALDPQAVAEIVRKVVEKTRPADDRSGRRVVEDLKASLSDFEVDHLVRKLTERYVEEVSRRRADARASGRQWEPPSWDRLDPWDFITRRPPPARTIRRRISRSGRRSERRRWP